MRTTLDEIAPGFIAMAHSIGIAVAATIGGDGHPRTRPVQPVWEWSGGDLVGWVTTEAGSPKVAHVRARPSLSLTYWNPDQDTCTADCAVAVVTGDADREATWERFLHAPGAARFDLSTHPAWDGPTDPVFGVLRLHPNRLRVVPGSVMTEGSGTVRTWQRMLT